jgi:small conductance mechanosensitive channel
MITTQAGQIGDFLERHGLATLVLVIAALIVFGAVRPVVHRALVRILHHRSAALDAPDLAADEIAKRVATIEDLTSTVLRVAVVLVTLLVLLTWFELLPVIAGLGVLLAALTLAGQSIVLDYLMGALIVLEGPYYKGDWVQIGGVEGEVEVIGLRRTILRDASGTVHSVSNGQVRVASNLTRVFARMQVDVTVAFGTDLDAATRLVDDVGRAMIADPDWHDRLLETPTLTRVTGLGDLGATLRVAGKVRAADRWAAPSELRKRLLAAFQANGIELPVRGRVIDERGASTTATADAPASAADPASEPGQVE